MTTNDRADLFKSVERMKVDDALDFSEEDYHHLRMFLLGHKAMHPKRIYKTKRISIEGDTRRIWRKA